MLTHLRALGGATLKAAWITVLALGCVYCFARSQPAAVPQQANQTATQQQTAPAEQSAIATQLRVFVYPTKQQTQAQRSQDEQECLKWANSAVASEQPNAQNSSGQNPTSVARGAVRGAATGTAVGALAGSASTGRTVGTTAGAMSAAQQQRSGESDQQAEAAQQQQTNDAVRRAFSACMEPRDYNVR